MSLIKYSSVRDSKFMDPETDDLISQQVKFFL